MSAEVHIWRPDPKVFRKEWYPPNKPENFGPMLPYLLEKEVYLPHQGIYRYLQGMLYPQKCSPFPEAIMCINVAKRLLIDLISFLKKHWWFLIFLNIKTLDKLFEIYNRSVSSNLIDSVAVDKKYMAELPKELEKFTLNFLYKLGFRYTTAEEFAKVFGTIIQYDSAYYHRLQDFLSNTTKKDLLESPITEIRKLTKLSYDREENKRDVSWKFRYVAILFRIAYLSRKVRQAFKYALLQSEFENFQYDEIDLYHVLMRGNYNYLGLTFPQRFELFKDLHHGKPPVQFSIV